MLLKFLVLLVMFGESAATLAEKGNSATLG